MQVTLLQTQLQSENQKSYSAYTKQDLTNLLLGNVPIRVITFGGHYCSSLLSAQKDFCQRGLDKAKFYEQMKKKKPPEPER